MSVNIEEPIMPPEEVQIKFVVPTVEESIERLGFMAGKMGYPDSSAARRGKNALKKEIPMSDHYTGVCAKCGERVKTNEIYCHRCGQKQPKAVYKGKPMVFISKLPIILSGMIRAFFREFPGVHAVSASQA